jgi:chromosomal replication initiator protein
MLDYKQLWENCLIQIEANVSKANFSTWFKNTSIMKEDMGTIYIAVPNEFVKDWLYNKFHKLILKTLVDFNSEIRGVEYIIAKQDSVKAKQQEYTHDIKTFINKELPLQDLYINKDDNLNPRYVFDSFIVGPFNEIAYATGQAIIKKPGKVYNPFFVYGGTGLGKTHLIQAIGNSIKTNFPEKKVHYTTLEKFSVDYVTSVQNNKPNLFKEKYRKYDVIIIDDIQFLTGKERTQEELFHLFNTFYENNKQIVFSSDKHPNFITGLEDRLKSRFSSGMITDINEPEYESRIAILKTKIKESDIFIPDDVVEYLASALQGNIRELEGSLNSILIQSQLKNRALTIQEAKNLIKNNIRPKKSVSIKDVVKAVADYFNIEEEIIYEKTRRKEIVHARQIVMYILREEFNVSYPLIGQKLGGKDHTTVIHSCLKVKNDLKTNNELMDQINSIKILFK